MKIDEVNSTVKGLYEEGEEAKDKLAKGAEIIALDIMRIFNMYDARLAIATGFEIERIPKPEPGFFQVTYGISDLRDKAGGRGKQLMQAMCDAVEKYRDYFRKLEHEGESGPSQCDACSSEQPAKASDEVTGDQGINPSQVGHEVTRELQLSYFTFLTHAEGPQLAIQNTA